jgi:hypothetical protein
MTRIDDTKTLEVLAEVRRLGHDGPFDSFEQMCKLVKAAEESLKAKHESH